MRDEEILERSQAPEDGKSLIEYLQRFDFVLPLMQSYRNLELATYDVARQAYLDNVKYIEIRFAPMQHTQAGLSLEEVVEAVLAGCERAEADFDLRINLLICGLKHLEVAQLEKLLPIYDHISSEHLVGFDLAGDEANFPVKKFESLLGQVQSRGVQLTIHAGECVGCAQNMIDAVAFGATRLGHGVCAREFTPEELDKLIADQTILEMAPSSNFQTKAVTKLDEYPFKDLYDKGVHVTINTDNRTVSNTTLQKEYEKIADWYDFKVTDFEKINHYAIDGAFANSYVREELHELFAKEYAELAK